MKHRHLNHEEYTLSAVDDIIGRGRMSDWIELRDEAREHPSIFEKIQRVCIAHIADQYAQRYHFWYHYAKKHIS